MGGTFSEIFFSIWVMSSGTEHLRMPSPGSKAVLIRHAAKKEGPGGCMFSVLVDMGPGLETPANVPHLQAWRESTNPKFLKGVSRS